MATVVGLTLIRPAPGVAVAVAARLLFMLFCLQGIVHRAKLLPMLAGRRHTAVCVCFAVGR